MTATRLRPLEVLRARHLGKLETRSRRRLCLLWNAAALLVSSVGLALLSLTLAIGPFGWDLFRGYFTPPLIFVLNWLPILLLQLLLWLLLGRQWLAFLLSDALFLSASVGNFFKLCFRYEPFSFRDLSAITAGLKVAGNYSLYVNSRILALLLYTLAGTLLLALLARLRPGRRIAFAGTALVLISLIPLWRGVYQNDRLYYETLSDTGGMVWEQQYFMTKGFVYPFLYSVKSSRDLAPEGYDAREAAALLNGYADAAIPEERKVELLVFQLESFTDLRSMGFSGIDEAAYALWDALAAESYSGRLIANTTGGGTIDSERCFLSGSYGLQSYRGDAPSYVRYLGSQGYRTIGSHPNRADYYNRVNINRYLGFDEYYFLNNYYEALTGGDWDCDAVLIPEVFRQFEDLIAQNAPVFSFNVTLQCHSPYRSDGYNSETRLFSLSGVSEGVDCVLNNYLASLRETQELLIAGIERLRDAEKPVVVLLYGDHTPYFTEAPVYAECGVSFDMGTEEGFFAYYGTPYLIWANDAAKEQLGTAFSGEGPTLSPGYLMNLLFERLGWEGSAFSQFTDRIRARLPVVSTNGAWVENGVFTAAPDAESRALLRDYEWAQYWLRGSMG